MVKMIMVCKRAGDMCISQLIPAHPNSLAFENFVYEVYELVGIHEAFYCYIC
jgi:hypothetical protein